MDSDLFQTELFFSQKDKLPNIENDDAAREYADSGEICICHKIDNHPVARLEGLRDWLQAWLAGFPYARGNYDLSTIRSATREMFFKSLRKMPRRENHDLSTDECDTIDQHLRWISSWFASTLDTPL